MIAPVRPARGWGLRREWIRMAKFTFDSPITLQRNIVVRTLDDAAAFMRSYKDAKLPMARDAVLHRLENACAEHELHIAANVFLTWAYAEELITQVA
jgi:hypothetical protein